MSEQLLVKVLNQQATPPTRAHSGDAGLDLYASDWIIIPPLSRRLVPTGIAITIPEGTVGSIRPRSGLAVRHGITVLNTPGTIDRGYTGEVKVCLYNSNENTPISISLGDRIAQLVCEKIAYPEVVIVDELPQSEDGRGGEGFGSTGH